MDRNVEKMKSLLEGGYRMTSHKVSYKANDGNPISEERVKLKKGENTETITSVNSEEFDNYIKHFKKVRNEFDNDEFVFIEDLESYNKLIEKRGRADRATNNTNILEIGGDKFLEGVLTVHLDPSGSKKPKGIAEFWINLEKNPNIKKSDLTDGVKIYDLENNLIMGGFVINSQISENTLFLVIRDGSLKLESKKMSLEMGGGISPAEKIAFITECSGLKSHFHGISVNTSKREFEVILPVINLIIDDEFKIGDVTFYQKFDTSDDSLIRKSDFGRSENSWNGNFPRAKVNVKANSFYQATHRGYNQVTKAVDVISLRNDFSLSSFNVNGEEKQINFSYYKNLSQVKISPWIYCRQKNTQSYIIYNSEFKNANILALQHDPQDFFSGINDLCSELVSKSGLSQKEKNLLQSLHWLRRSMQDGNDKDKLADLWTSFEFLNSGIKEDIPPFDKSLREKLKGILVIDELSPRQKEIVENKLNSLNDIPLMRKFDIQKEKYNLEISEEDIHILKLARNKRNDLIHGKKDINVDEKELKKMRTIIERLLIEKVSDLI